MEFSSSVVIKVKYGHDLRRFNARVVDGKMEFGFDGLREKVTSLFGFSKETELGLTYVDEDNDDVTLANDDDLTDVVKQGLNPVRIIVRLKTGNSELMDGLPDTPEAGKGPRGTRASPMDTLFGSFGAAVTTNVASKLHDSALGVAGMSDNLGKKGLEHLITKPTEQPSSHGDIPESSKAAATRSLGQSKSDAVPMEVSLPENSKTIVPHFFPSHPGHLPLPPPPHTFYQHPFFSKSIGGMAGAYPQPLPNHFKHLGPVGSPFPGHHGVRCEQLGASSGVCMLDSCFIQDITISDGTFMAPKSPFTKIWRLRNNGKVMWPKKTQLVWVGGKRLCKGRAFEVDIPEAGIQVNQDLDVAVDFIAPELPGQYFSYWRMRSPSGEEFGQHVWVLIEVDASLKETGRNGANGFDLNSPLIRNNADGPAVNLPLPDNSVKMTGSGQHINPRQPQRPRTVNPRSGHEVKAAARTFPLPPPDLLTPWSHPAPHPPLAPTGPRLTEMTFQTRLEMERKRLLRKEQRHKIGLIVDRNKAQGSNSNVFEDGSAAAAESDDM